MPRIPDKEIQEIVDAGFHFCMCPSNCDTCRKTKKVKES